MTSKHRAFTLVELLVAILVSGILISVTTSTYLLFRRSIAQDQGRAELNQNARISLERMSRELRQARSIVTLFPTSPADTSVTQPHEIEFEDGHPEPGEADYLTYRRYYVVNQVLKLDIKYYHLNGSTIHIPYNSSSAIPTILSTQDIAERVSDLSFYQTSGTIQVILTTSDGGVQNYKLATTILKRN